jgi:DNA processing protein
MTEELASDLAEAGVVIASGMARGIDGAAHEGALAVGGKTIAVLGTGVDIAYPREHGRLREQIGQTGLLITELPPGAPPRAFHFPRRNRILAALAHVVVVVEAEPKSGALVTARWALELGRDVMAVPRSPWEAGSLGVNRLLRDGAHPVLDAGDVLLALGRLGFGDWATSSKSPREPRARSEGSIESRVLTALETHGPLDTQGLLDSLGDIPMADLLTHLGRLELKGRIQHGRQGYEIPRAREGLPLS